jgi:signal transduction histidine kinase
VYSYYNHIFLFICIGGIFLAAVYHTILYLHRKESLLNYYSQYLWVLLFYLLFRVDLYFDLTRLDFYKSPYHWDEIFQMAGFMFYIRFLCKAVFLKKSDYKYAWYFYSVNAPVILIYCFLLLAFTNFQVAIIVLKIAIRIYLLTFGLLFVLILWQKKKSLYYKYLFAAAVSMIFFGVVSSVSMLLHINFFGLGPFHWLLVSFYIDVIFFSAALGYLIRQEYQQKESSLKQLLKSEAELQQKELEKMKAVYETREEERMRIARDLHDDMGSTLSSISIYSKVVSSYIENDTAKANEYLDKIKDNTAMLMENTTDLIWSLQTNYGQSESIFKRMQDTGIQILSSAGIAPHFSVTLPQQMPQLNIKAQKNCWLIFKEALNNVCKYSKAANCNITIAADEESLLLSITDDGIGFKEIKEGNGFVNMRQRTEELEGKFTIESTAVIGTTISAKFNLQKILMPVQ